MKTKLEHYILGMLIFNPLTGYEIKKDLDTEGRFVRTKAPLSQIYTTLKRMTENNLISFVEERREGKPDLKIYSITREGKNALIGYLRSPLKHTFRFNESSIIFKIRFAFLVETEVIVNQIQEELDFRQKQISQFRHRDRSIPSSILPTKNLAYAQAIFDQVHNYGADRMDLYIAHLKKIRSFFEKYKKP